MLTELEELNAMITGTVLGPATVAEVAGFPGALQVTVTDCPHKVDALAAWVDLIRPHDMTIGKFRRTDTMGRLNVRGIMPNGVPIIVTVPFSEQAENQTRFPSSTASFAVRLPCWPLSSSRPWLASRHSRVSRRLNTDARMTNAPDHAKPWSGAFSRTSGAVPSGSDLTHFRSKA
jgi:hypothetical protein